LFQNFTMRDFIRKNYFIIIFSLAGAIGGFLYWKFIGCESGTCPIKSKWYLSTLWGLAFGYLGGSILKDLYLKISERRKLKGDNNSEKDN
jgi:hypothetical protein